MLLMQKEMDLFKSIRKQLKGQLSQFVTTISRQVDDFIVECADKKDVEITMGDYLKATDILAMLQRTMIFSLNPSNSRRVDDMTLMTDDEIARAGDV